MTMSGESLQVSQLKDRLALRLLRSERLRVSGRASEVRGPLLKASVITHVGEICGLYEPGKGRVGSAQVVGFVGGEAFLAPFGDIQGLSPRTEVVPFGHSLEINCSSQLLGKLVGPYGEVLSHISDSSFDRFPQARMQVEAAAPKASDRKSVSRVFKTGIRAIDGLLTIGRGQRMGIFGPPGSGKSQLVLNLLANSEADITIIGLVGERGREVPDFIESMRLNGKIDRCAVVATTSDSPAQDRLIGAMTATTMAEYFRNQGLNVLLIIDSITRVARAAREIGLAMGEPAVRRGFTPSVFQMLPRLLERSGTAKTGTITAFYTILSEGEEKSDPIFEECKSLLDGHIVLSPKLASTGHYPAIDVLSSVSRTMTAVVDSGHLGNSQRFRQLWGALDEIAILRRIGEYKQGGDRVADAAIAQEAKLRSFLVQKSSEATSFAETLSLLSSVSE